MMGTSSVDDDDAGTPSVVSSLDLSDAFDVDVVVTFCVFPDWTTVSSSVVVDKEDDCACGCCCGCCVVGDLSANAVVVSELAVISMIETDVGVVVAVGELGKSPSPAFPFLPRFKNDMFLY